jgi:serine phosphatase RsbU (regulator of sigma subunit)
LDKGSSRRRDLCLKIYNIYKRQTSIPSAGIEPAITKCERPQTYVLDSAALGIGLLHTLTVDIFKVFSEIGGTIFLRNVGVCEIHHSTSLLDSVEIARRLQEMSLSNSALVETDVLSVLGQ